MVVKSIFTRLNNVGQALNPQQNFIPGSNTDNAPSRQIWFDFPKDGIDEGLDEQGIFFKDEFTSFPKTVATTEGNYGQYSQFAGATGAITADTASGSLVFTSTASGDAVSIRTHSTPFRIDRSLGKLWFEARVQASTITDGLQQMFVGLMADIAQTAAIPIASTTALANTNIVGFFQQGTGTGYGAAMDTIYKASGVTAVTVQAKAVTLAAGTWTKLGMVFQPYIDPLIQDPALTNAGKYNLSFYQDGVRLGTVKNIPVAQGTDFPNSVYMGPVFTFQSRSSTPGNILLDWWRVGQVYSAGWTGQ